jgi:hypothetical protein
MPVLKPARWRPPAKRACSIFRQRSWTTSSPPPRPGRRLVVAQTQLEPHGLGADGDGVVHHRRKLLGTAEGVDDVGGLRQVRQRRVAPHPQNLFVHRVHGIDRVARAHQVGGDEVRRSQRVGGDADQGHRAGALEDGETVRWRSRRVCRSLRTSQSLIEIPNDVLHIFDAHRDADHVVADTGGGRSSVGICWWVVDAGWITSVLASPMLARWLASSTPSMNFTPDSKPPRDRR